MSDQSRELTCSASFHSHFSISAVHACVPSQDSGAGSREKWSLPPADSWPGAREREREMIPGWEEGI